MVGIYLDVMTRTPRPPSTIPKYFVGVRPNPSPGEGCKHPVGQRHAPGRRLPFHTFYAEDISVQGVKEGVKITELQPDNGMVSVDPSDGPPKIYR